MLALSRCDPSGWGALEFPLARVGESQKGATPSDDPRMTPALRGPGNAHPTITTEAPLGVSPAKCSTPSRPRHPDHVEHRSVCAQRSPALPTSTLARPADGELSCSLQDCGRSGRVKTQSTGPGTRRHDHVLGQFLDPREPLHTQSESRLDSGLGYKWPVASVRTLCFARGGHPRETSV